MLFRLKKRAFFLAAAFSCLLFFPRHAFADATQLKDAQEKVSKLEYEKARPILQRLANSSALSSSQKQQALFSLALCHFFLSDPEKAKASYQEALRIDLNATPAVPFPANAQKFFNEIRKEYTKTTTQRPPPPSPNYVPAIVLLVVGLAAIGGGAGLLAAQSQANDTYQNHLKKGSANISPDEVIAAYDQINLFGGLSMASFGLGGGLLVGSVVLFVMEAQRTSRPQPTSTNTPAKASFFSVSRLMMEVY